MADSDTPVLDLLASMTADSLEASSLDSEELMLVRLAALVAVDAPPASYVLNLGAASELGFGVEDVQGVLAADRPDRRHGADRVRDGEHRPRARLRARGRRARRE